MVESMLTKNQSVLSVFFFTLSIQNNHEASA